MIPFSISIHAPREGCDACPVTWSAAQRRISIHAPREGCDGRRPDRRPSSPDFNPRTPRGVRPLNHPHQGAVLDISIHAPREGCDQRGVDRRSTVIQFQSTHPARGATDHKRPSGFLYVISIHAPREGCDQSAMRSTVRDMAHFNPRTPRGVRPVVAPIKWYGCRNFNPRTPRGVRLRSRFALPRYAQISIHAPREGCDPGRQSARPELPYFNPRTPRGVRRPAPGRPYSRLRRFQSTHPARGATPPRRRPCWSW